MSARRIARELAVILLPQLTKKKDKFAQVELESLVAQAVHMLCDYARENLAEADAMLSKAASTLTEVELEHPANRETIEEVVSVPLTTKQLKKQIDKLSRAIHLISEALDVPAFALQSAITSDKVVCSQCGNSNNWSNQKAFAGNVCDFLSQLLNTYLAHRTEIDQYIKQVKSRWQIDRMVSIDRDILRLACTETFFMPEIPIPVAINEAVELCHRFADDKAARFVNGILADLSSEARYFRAKGVLPEREVAPVNEALVPE